MEKIIGYHLSNCPKGYGSVKFFGLPELSKGLVCPISEAEFCYKCDVIPYKKLDATYQVKKVKE